MFLQKQKERRVPPFDLASLAPTLEQREPGLWFARQRQEPISYPAHGNAACLAVEVARSGSGTAIA